MRVARLYDYLDVRIEDDPTPQIGRDEILVRARACGICSGDVVPWYIRKKAPLVFGHEPVGEVAEVGSDVTEFSVGQRVFVHHHAPCFDCSACARGEFVQCATWKSSRIVPGGMAEFFRVPRVNLRDTLVLPDGLPFDDAALIEPVACVVKSLRRAGDVCGKTVFVIGLGVMGQLHVILARHAGARTILAADLVDERCNRAKQLGADVVFDASRVNLEKSIAEATEGEGASLVIAGPASVQVLELGLKTVSRGGTVIQFMGTEPGDRLQLDTFDYYFREIRLLPSYSCGPSDTREALRLISAGVVGAGQVVTHRFPLEGAADAYRVAATDTAALKTLVTMAS